MSGMGWWRWFVEFCTEPDRRETVELTVSNVRRKVRSVHGDPKAAYPLEVERLKDIIRSCTCRGGKVHYKEALAIWAVECSHVPGADNGGGQARTYS